MKKALKSVVLLGVVASGVAALWLVSTTLRGEQANAGEQQPASQNTETVALPRETAFVAKTEAANKDARGLPPGIRNTQNPKDIPLTPEQSLAKITVPEGFHVSLFAGEPDVAQPIAITFDNRGRLWVGECYSYKQWNTTGSDRILIFEDTDNDGQFDKRTVFWDKANNLTGIALGFGGVWACCAPNLIFIPDADADGVPDGEPVVKITGWNYKTIGHNIFNGIDWGPDGWLYGCHGITSPSPKVGKPGSKPDDRLFVHNGIWRYHPVTEELEIVCNGTTNPWGLDWDDYGEAFFTNCVIGHLWHAVPGAHFKRMFGQDPNPHVYGLIESTSDHLHWAGEKWTGSRGGKGIHDKLGGGHAHCGTMIYLGDNWPDKYRNWFFTANIHGNRINADRLERRGSGYVGKHEDDLMKANDPWFRGVRVKYGPDGGVYVTDWHDLGECHDHDGVHRSSGRIYKIIYGEPKKPLTFNIGEQSDTELVELHLHKNDWFVRRARLVLQERAHAGKDTSAAKAALLRMFSDHEDVTRKLRAMWTLHAMGEASPQWLHRQLDHQSEHVRNWAIRLICEGGSPKDQTLTKMAEMATSDASPKVRLALCSALQRLDGEDRWEIATRLAAHEEDNEDALLPLMLWYGVEAAVPDYRTQAIQLAAASKISLLRKFIFRRLAEASKDQNK